MKIKKSADGREYYVMDDKDEPTHPPGTDPLAALLTFGAALASGPEVAIDEATRGQACRSAQNQLLPIPSSQKGREALESFGVKFGEPSGDRHFHVELPEGWYQRTSKNDSRWGELLDTNETVRARIWHGQFGEFNQETYVDRRFHVSLDYEKRKLNHVIVAQVHDARNGVIHETLPIKMKPETAEGWNDDKQWNRDEEEKATAEAKQWLQENYPESDTLTGHWEE